MSDVKTHEISQKGKKLVKDIGEELEKASLLSPDNFGNQEYKPNNELVTKVNQLKAELQINVGVDALIEVYSQLNVNSYRRLLGGF